MAQSKSDPEASTEAAYAEASAKVPVKKPAKPAARKVAVKAKPVAAPPAAPIVDSAPVVEPSFLEPALTEPVVAAPQAEEMAPAVVQAAAAPPAKPPILSLKDISMTTDFTANITETMSEAASEVQAKFQQAFDKSSSVVTEMTELTKGNVEAVVESGKLFAAGVQDLGKTYADEAKAAYETATADIKEMAAIKSPTELFQLQGKILRRNFDMFIAATSKSTDAALKLANDAMAPISGRVNVAAEKLSQVAA